MKYITGNNLSALSAKLIGTYEKELSPVINEICERKFSYCVDIGCAEGYYAVGLALRNPTMHVTAYDCNPEALDRAKRMAGLNNCDSRIVFRGECKPADLATLQVQNEEWVVICDCEGSEAELLDPVAVPALSRAYILVEMHDFCKPGVTDLIYKNFEGTHSIVRVEETPRCLNDFPFKDFYFSLVPSKVVLSLVSEYRPVLMHWLWLKPKSPLGP